MDKKDPMSRGLQFHEEAMALWIEEDSKPSLVNLQALYILALEYVGTRNLPSSIRAELTHGNSSTIRGNDKLGWELLGTMQDMYRKLGLGKDPVEADFNSIKDREKYVRVWQTISWSIFNMNS